MTRSLSRLSKIFMTFSNNSTSKYVYDMPYPALNANTPLETQISIGPVRYPAWGALKEIPEYYWSLQQAIGSHDSVIHSNSIDLADWTGNAHVIGFNLDKVQSDDGSQNYAGISTKIGDLVNVRCANLNTSIDTCWVHMQYDSLMTVGENGVEIFE